MSHCRAPQLYSLLWKILWSATKTTSIQHSQIRHHILFSKFKVFYLQITVFKSCTQNNWLINCQEYYSQIMPVKPIWKNSISGIRSSYTKTAFSDRHCSPFSWYISAILPRRSINLRADCVEASHSNLHYIFLVGKNDIFENVPLMIMEDQKLKKIFFTQSQFWCNYTTLLVIAKNFVLPTFLMIKVHVFLDMLRFSIYPWEDNYQRRVFNMS